MTAPIADSHALREDADRSLAEGRFGDARVALAELWLLEPSSATAGFVVSRFERLRGHVDLLAQRIFVLRSFTVEPCIPLLRASAFCGGIDLEVRLGEFNAIAQEILDLDSPLYRFAPHAVIVAWQTRDVTPKLWHSFAGSPPAEIEMEIKTTGERLSGLIGQLRAKTTAAVVVHSLEAPDVPALGVLDASLSVGQKRAVNEINVALAVAARQHRGVYLLDMDGLLSARGRDQWRDERKWVTKRMPIAAPELVHLAREWLKYLHPIAGKIAKVAVCDLDNTLWGGVIGEDGLSGIEIGTEHPGSAYREMQRALLDLRERGILLALCSKNNPTEAMEVFEKHPEMLLRKEHFAAVRINWKDKAENLRSIAEELNVGLDALAFLDDNRVERRWVQSQAPEVAIVHLPESPYEYAKAVRSCPLFERLVLSAEDQERARHYAEQRQRAELQDSIASVEDFLRSLAQVVEVSAIDQATIGRAAQLTQKTNQFNLTTRRYTEAELSALAASGEGRAFVARVRDRFGDNGNVGLAILKLEAKSATIDTFLLSCRVIGRTVETALLSFLADFARRAGADELIGRFIPTKKNGPAKEFFPSHGFTCRIESEQFSEWVFDLNRPIPWPPWIERSTPETPDDR